MDKMVPPPTQKQFSVSRLAALENRRYCSSHIGQRGWGKDEAEIFGKNDCVGTCSLAYICGTRRWRRGIAGGKQRRHPFLSVFAEKPERPVHHGLQRLCGRRRPFGLCDHALCPDPFVVHHLRLGLECTVTEGCRRTGDEILRVRPQPLQGHYRGWLRSCGIEVGRQASAWAFFKWAGQDEIDTHQTNYCIDACRPARIYGTRYRGGWIAGGQQGRHPILASVVTESKGALHEVVQRLCRGEWPLGLRDHILLARRRSLHHLRCAAERAISEGRGRVGVAKLSGWPEKVEGSDRERRLQNRGFEIGSFLPDRRRPRQTREAPCSPRS